jgi:hypothetical protein
MATTKTGFRESQYFSGQGVLFLAERNATTGLPKTFNSVGNVSALSLGLETTDFDHKESQTGSRSIDLTLVQELNASLVMTLESIDRENLTLGLFGTGTDVALGTESNEQHTVTLNAWIRLDRINMNTLVVGSDATPTITYELGKNYEVDEEHGMVFFYSDADQTTKGAAANIANDAVAFCSYSFGAYTEVKGFTASSGVDKWAEFAGLNTADTSKPVQISVFKATSTPLAELALITDEVTQMEVTMSIKQDTLRAAADQFFTVRQVQTRYVNPVLGA